MRISLPGDILIATAFEPSMVLQNHNTVAARSSSRNSNDSSSNNTTTNGNTTNHQRPVIDLLVAMIAVPILILCALQLEKNLHDMANSPESRWLVFALGVGMLIVSVIICGYVTHRMGVCIWAGPIDEAGNRIGGRRMPHINSQNDVLRIVDTLPPSYDSVVKFDIPPPPYDCLVIDIEQCKDEEDQTATTTTTTTSATTNANCNTNGSKALPTEITSVHI